MQRQDIDKLIKSLEDEISYSSYPDCILLAIEIIEKLRDRVQQLELEKNKLFPNRVSSDNESSILETMILIDKTKQQLQGDEVPKIKLYP